MLKTFTANAGTRFSKNTCECVLNLNISNLMISFSRCITHRCYLPTSYLLAGRNADASKIKNAKSLQSRWLTCRLQRLILGKLTFETVGLPSVKYANCGACTATIDVICIWKQKWNKAFTNCQLTQQLDAKFKISVWTHPLLSFTGTTVNVWLFYQLSLIL